MIEDGYRGLVTLREMKTTLLSVLAGRAVPYTREGSRSGIAKHPVPGRVWVSATGITGDEQGDLRVHGGPDKAIHHYAWDHYIAWREEVLSDILDQPGAFGENFSTAGWTEASVNFGDIVEAGSCLLQVSQARQPCWKLNDRFAYPHMAARVQSSGRTGWYYRVLREGWVEAGSTIRIVERPFPEWTLKQLVDLLFRRTLDRSLLESANLLPLPPSWKILVQRRLERNETESWINRLEGPQKCLLWD